jgi:hypothetical protein
VKEIIGNYDLDDRNNGKDIFIQFCLKEDFVIKKDFPQTIYTEIATG